ncbi:MAG: HAMP domain-containing sensor histidine kinase [Acidobacteriaceae bacterium]
MSRLRLRTTLMIPLLLLSFGGTVVSLLILRSIVQHQVRASLTSDLQHSVMTYQNLARQRRELLDRESALLADLPSLKALMTGDERTIVDGGTEFWRVSGSDFFALLDRNGKLIAAYNRGVLLDHSTVQQQMESGLEHSDGPALLCFAGRLYEVSVHPLLFGSTERNSRLGLVALGYEVDQRVAREVSEAAAAEVAFTARGSIVASTLKPDLQRQLSVREGQLLRAPAQDRNLTLGGDHYLAAAVPLGPNVDGNGAPQLVVLKSFEQAALLNRRVNQWVMTLALFALVTGAGMLISISRTLTRPIGALVEGTRALAEGNFNYRLREDGVQEIRELSRAFERMRVELKRTQNDLLDSERLATIGRMASSVSHDLRHYLSAMYANAEFLSDGRLPQSEREDLFLDVKAAVQGMTDLLDSLLLFTQTGRALHPAPASLAALAQYAVGLVRSHPAARDVSVVATGHGPLEACVDSKKLGRAMYNLLLNACQAARRGRPPAQVTIYLAEDEWDHFIQVIDNGPGVPERVRQTMFMPFVSEGKESGVGLGLTLAQQIAQEHGGKIELEESLEGRTVFTMTLPKAALAALAEASSKGASASPEPENSAFSATPSGIRPTAPDHHLVNEAET